MSHKYYQSTRRRSLTYALLVSQFVHVQVSRLSIVLAPSILRCVEMDLQRQTDVLCVKRGLLGRHSLLARFTPTCKEVALP